MANLKKTDKAEPQVEEKPKSEISEEDKITFYKAFISDQPFKKKYSIFNGKDEIEFRVLSVKDNAAVQAQVLQDKINGVHQMSDAYMMTITMYRLCFGLLKIGAYMPDQLPETESLAEKIEVFQKWSTAKLTAAVSYFDRFNNLALELTTYLDDSDFWPADL